MNTIGNPKCNRCKSYIVVPEINPRSSVAYKSCLKCRERLQSKKCPHKKMNKAQCRECNGSAYCKHDKIKARCRECNGSAFCKHDKIRSNLLVVFLSIHL